MTEIEDFKIQYEEPPVPTPITPESFQGLPLDLLNVVNLIEVVSVVPAGVPVKFWDQFKIYTNGATYRFYWYDNVNRAWRYATGT